MTPILNRRSLLRASLGVACSAAAHPWVTPVLHAAVPGDNRLVVILLRGAMDGIGLVQPHGDPGLAALRPTLALQPGAGLTDLDGFFGLHDHLGALLPMWRAGQLGFVHAVSTPYRDKRSHFDGQDMLEAGSNDPTGSTRGRDGWLNRALTLMGAAKPDLAMAVGQDYLLLLAGAAPAGSWSPANELTLQDDERRLLSMLYAGDPLFAKTLGAAQQFSAIPSEGEVRENGKTLAAFAAKVLNGPSRIAAFSVGGWDSHRRQANTLAGPSLQLTTALLTLQTDLGRNWDHTLVIALTEFGRTARENGSAGTDHGTGGMMLVAGGAARGGKVFGRWPGLGEGALYADRDVMPTDDLRRYAAWALAAQFGLDRAGLEGVVFPGLDLGTDPGFLA